MLIAVTIGSALAVAAAVLPAAAPAPAAGAAELALVAVAAASAPASVADRGPGGPGVCPCPEVSRGRFLVDTIIRAEPPPVTAVPAGKARKGEITMIQCWPVRHAPGYYRILSPVRGYVHRSSVETEFPVRRCNDAGR